MYAAAESASSNWLASYLHRIIAGHAEMACVCGLDAGLINIVRLVSRTTCSRVSAHLHFNNSNMQMLPGKTEWPSVDVLPRSTQRTDGRLPSQAAVPDYAVDGEVLADRCARSMTGFGGTTSR